MEQNKEKDINQMCEEYCVVKKQSDILEKRVKELSTKIKQYLDTNGIDTIETQTGICKLTYREKITFDEPELCEYLKAHNITQIIPGIVKTKEYVDMDTFEGALYTQQINASDIAGFRHITKTPVLNVR